MLRPEFVTPEILLRSLPELIVQSLLITAWVTETPQHPAPILKADAK